MSKRGKERLPASEVSAFCEQMALLLKGGIPIYESTCMIYEENDQIEEKKILKELQTFMKKKIPLHKALGKCEVFPEYMVHMVKIGETTGRLAEVMDSLAAYYEREHKVRENIKHVVIYPLMLFIVLGIILLILVLKVLPVFQSVFHGLDTNGSREAEVMMKVSMELGKSVAVVVLLLIVLIVGLLLFSRSEDGHRTLKKVGNYLPCVRVLNYKLETAKFISAMSIMIGSGMESRKSLELASGLTEHPVLKRRILLCLRNIRNRMALEDALRQSGILIGKNGRMISIGGKTGSIIAVLEKIKVKYEEEADESLHGITATVETVLVIAVSVVIGGVLIAIVLPLISIISTIG